MPSLAKSQSCALALLSGILASLFAVCPLQALPLVDPSLQYRTYRTTHFAIHYPEGYLENAISLGNLAEARHRDLESRYNSRVDVTNIILIPRTDTVNAFASTYVLNRVALYVQSPFPGEFSRFDLWQDHLFVHEYTHVLNLYPYRGAANVVLRIFAGLPPNFLTPTGLIEGFPVYEESQTGKGRLKDPITDMILRAAIQEDRFPRLEEIMAGTHRWPMGQTPYLFGGRFVQFMREYPEYQQSGASAALDSYFLQEDLPVFSSSRLRSLGYPDMEEIYERFYDTERMRARAETLGENWETRFRRITRSGFQKKFLQRSGNELFFFGSLDADSGIFSVPLEGLNLSTDLHEPGALEGDTAPARHSLSLFRVPRSSAGFTFLPGPNGQAELIASQESFPNASGFRYQLYKKGGLWMEEVEPGQRILFPSAEKDRVLYVKREDPLRYLMMARMDPEHGFRDERILLSTDLHGILSHSVLSPDGSLAIAVYRGGTAGHPYLIGCRTEVAVMQPALPSGDESGRCRVLISGNGVVTQPSFSSDGILFSSDITGRYEVFLLKKGPGPWSALLEQTDFSVQQLSQTNTGLFYPVLAEDSLFALRYFANGYDLVSMQRDDLLSVDVSSEFSSESRSFSVSEFHATSDSVLNPATEQYNGAFEVRPYFAGLLFGVSAAESGIVAFDPLERHNFSVGLGIVEDTPYAGISYEYNRYAHSFHLSYSRSSLEKRAFYCDEPRGAILYLCLENDYQFEYGSTSIQRDLPGREVDQQYTFGLNHQKHRNTSTLASPVFPVHDLNLASVFAGYGITNTVVFPLSISEERGFSFYGEAAFYPEDWVLLYDDYSDQIENGEFYSIQSSLEFFLPFFFDHHVPYVGVNGRWTSGKNPEIYRVRLSSYMRGLVPEYSPYGRGALVFTAEYRFPLFWLSRRLISWWPSLGIRYVSLAPFFDYGQSFERQVFKDTFIRSYGVYTDIGLHVFYLPIAIRLSYARGEGPAGETSFGFGILVGASAGANVPGIRDPFAHSLKQRQARMQSVPGPMH